MRLDTKKALIERFQYFQDDNALAVYNVLMRSMLNHPFKYFITPTYSRPITDTIAIQEANRKIKRFLNRRFYKSRDAASEIKYLFFIEKHAVQHKSQNKFHVHFLMTDPTNSKHSVETLPDNFKLMMMKSFIPKEISRIKSITSYSNAKILRTDIRLVNNQESLCDYLLKQLRSCPHDLLSMIDIQNSDIRFHNDDCINEEHYDARL